MVMARRRHRMAWFMFTLAFLLAIANVWLGVKLLDLQDKSWVACNTGNVLREDARLLLEHDGFVERAQHPALQPRPCDDLYRKGLRP